MSDSRYIVYQCAPRAYHVEHSSRSFRVYTPVIRQFVVEPTVRLFFARK